MADKMETTKQLIMGALGLLEAKDLSCLRAAVSAALPGDGGVWSDLAAAPVAVVLPSMSVHSLATDAGLALNTASLEALAEQRRRANDSGRRSPSFDIGSRVSCLADSTETNRGFALVPVGYVPADILIDDPLIS